MAALVQSYPQQSSTITMLQTRPSSASGILQSSSQTPSHHQYAATPTQMHRNSFHGMNNGMMSNYRGPAPIAPYAFTSTPGLVTGSRTQSGPHLRADQRASSTGAVPTTSSESANTMNRSQHLTAASVSTTSSSSDHSSSSQRSGPGDDSSVSSAARAPTGNSRSQLTVTPTSSHSLAAPLASPTTKTSPDRYRRPNNRRTESSPQSNTQASAMPNTMQFYGSSTQPPMAPPITLQEFNLQIPQFLRQLGAYTPTPGVVADDMQLNRHMSHEQSQKYRRRSIHTIDAAEYSHGSGLALQQQGLRLVNSANGRIDQQQQHPLRSSPVVAPRPGASHGRSGSSESTNSVRSNHHSRPNSVSCPSKPLMHSPLSDILTK